MMQAADNFIKIIIETNGSLLHSLVRKSIQFLNLVRIWLARLIH